MYKCTVLLLHTEWCITTHRVVCMLQDRSIGDSPPSSGLWSFTHFCEWPLTLHLPQVVQCNTIYNHCYSSQFSKRTETLLGHRFHCHGNGCLFSDHDSCIDTLAVLLAMVYHQWAVTEIDMQYLCPMVYSVTSWFTVTCSARTCDLYYRNSNCANVHGCHEEEQ